jgi:hypothetical protein
MPQPVRRLQDATAMKTLSARTALIVPFATLVACSSAPPGDGSTGSSADAITTSDVVARAEQWVGARLHYCQSAYGQPDPDSSCWAFEGPSHTCDDRESNPAWNPYRSDCSGFVTWAWGLPPVGDGGYVTGNFAPFDGAFSHVIAGIDLQAGDALNKVTNEHIVLFKQWIVRGQSAVFLEEPGCSVSPPYAHEFTSSVSISGSNVVIDYEGSTPFAAIRFSGVQNQPSRPAFVHGPGTPIALDARGHLALFAVDESGVVTVDRQDPAGPGGWTGWHEVDPAFNASSNPSVGVNHDGRLEVFAVGTDGEVQHAWEQHPGAGDFANFAPLGGKAVGNVAVALDSSDELEAFVVGTDHQMYHRWQDPKGAGGWTQDWVGLGGKFVSNPTVVKHPDGNLEVFAVGTDYQAQHAWHDPTKPGGWTQWFALGGNLNSDIGAAISAKGLAETFALDEHGVLDHDFEEASGQWFGWPNLGGNSWSVPAVALNSHGQLEAFVGGAGKELFHIWQQPTATGWGSWGSLGGSFTSNFVVGKNADGTLEVFGVGADHKVFHAFYRASTGGWSGWMSLGGAIARI